MMAKWATYKTAGASNLTISLRDDSIVTVLFMSGLAIDVSPYSRLPSCLIRAVTSHPIKVGGHAHTGYSLPARVVFLP